MVYIYIFKFVIFNINYEIDSFQIEIERIIFYKNKIHALTSFRISFFQIRNNNWLSK
jgi:hypothetical protein